MHEFEILLRQNEISFEFCYAQTTGILPLQQRGAFRKLCTRSVSQAHLRGCRNGDFIHQKLPAPGFSLFSQSLGVWLPPPCPHFLAMSWDLSKQLLGKPKPPRSRKAGTRAPWSLLPISVVTMVTGEQAVQQALHQLSHLHHHISCFAFLRVSKLFP